MAFDFGVGVVFLSPLLFLLVLEGFAGEGFLVISTAVEVVFGFIVVS